MGGRRFVKAGADARYSRAGMKRLQHAQHARNATVACKACHGGPLGTVPASPGAQVLPRQNPAAVPSVSAACRHWCGPV